MIQSKWKSVEEETEESNELIEKQFQEITRNETDLTDDHGLAILGNRIRKPIFLDDDDD